MTQEEIQERNKEIALMLGWTRHNHVSYCTWTKINSKDHLYESILQFDSNWNWLMDAVEFIEEKLKLKTVISNMGFGTNNQYININRGISIANESIDNPSKIMGTASTKKEAVFITVSDFAKLYNERKP